MTEKKKKPKRRKHEVYCNLCSKGFPSSTGLLELCYHIFDKHRFIFREIFTRKPVDEAKSSDTFDCDDCGLSFSDWGSYLHHRVADCEKEKVRFVKGLTDVMMREGFSICSPEWCLKCSHVEYCDGQNIRGS